MARKGTWELRDLSEVNLGSIRWEHNPWWYRGYIIWGGKFHTGKMQLATSGTGTATYEVMELLFNQPSSTAIKIENVFLLPTKQKFKFSSPQVF